jgi:hypothetical protein
VSLKDQWDDLRFLFEIAWPLAPPERVRLLEERCNGNIRLRRELEKLLAAHDDLAAKEAAPSVERRFGAWRTSSLIARGGMAEVYLAERADGHYQQRGALKVMPRHLLSWDYLDRFRREREILARLDHPNIARLLDGGVSDAGDPFLVMEFIDGRPLDQYCDDHHLPVRARLKIFLDLCSAVQSAHRNLVLHRDIKPSNVLVTADGSVKLLDFGTARRIDGTGLETTAPITPSYASPEQLRGEPVTTLSDVYGLGMTLYKVLAGTLPFGGAGRNAWQALQNALEGAVPAPSSAPDLAPALRRELGGDLDNIILKAIDRDPARRYSSAARLADDLCRYLERRPVEARPQTWRYRAGRFVARNRVGVVLAGLLALTLVAAAGALTVSERQARLEAARNRRLADFLTHVMGLGYDVDSGPLRAQGTAARAVDVLRFAADNLGREFAGQPRTEARLRADLGHALAELGYTDEASLNLSRGLSLVDPKRDTALAAELTGYLARSRFIEGDLHVAEAGFHDALRLAQAASPPIAAAPESILLINAAASFSTLHGPAPEVERLLNLAVSRARQVGEASPAYALALVNHGAMLWDRDRAADGDKEVLAAVAIQDRMSPRPVESCLVRLILADRAQFRGQLDEAGRWLGEARPCLEGSFKPGSLLPSYARLVSIEIDYRRGKIREVLDPLRSAEREVASALPKALWLRGETLLLRGLAACKLNQPGEGSADLGEASRLLSVAFSPQAKAVRTADAALNQCSAGR